MPDSTLQSAIALHQSGQLDEAEALYQRVLKKDRYNSDALHLVGLIQAQKGNPEDAIKSIQKAIRARPAIAEYHNNLAGILIDLSRFEEALATCQQAVSLQPNSDVAHFRLGTALQNSGSFDSAIASFERSLQLNPNFAEVHDALAVTLRKQETFDRAVPHHRRAVELAPDWEAARLNYATTLDESGDHAAALDEMTQAIRLIMSQAGSDTDESRQELLAGALFNLGNVLRNLGEFRKAADVFRQSIQVRPQLGHPWCGLIYIEQFLSGVTLQEQAELHTRWERECVRPSTPQFTEYASSRDPQRRLRVGIMSPNMREHPAAYLTVRAFENLDREQFELCFYSDCEKPDGMTQRVIGLADQWIESVTLTDEQLAQRIYADAVDILIVMAGHTDGNRLLVAARRPAPLQISWTGDPSGLSLVDCLIADRFIVPEEHDPFYAESVLRMPHGYTVFEPPTDSPDVGPPPFEQNGFITFGSFNQAIKYQPETLQCWAAILRELPDSRLILVGRGSETGSDRILAPFLAVGVTADRITLHDRLPRRDLLDTYNQVDITLDPFPFSGGVTTLESLWMGVPVVCLPGEFFAGRTSLTYLSNMNLSELITGNVNDYARKAVVLAGNPDELRRYRTTLRDLLSVSPLTDGPVFATALTHCLRDRWSEWCRTA